jgi:hypothetical protein
MFKFGQVRKHNSLHFVSLLNICKQVFRYECNIPNLNHLDSVLWAGQFKYCFDLEDIVTMQ